MLSVCDVPPLLPLPFDPLQPANPAHANRTSPAAAYARRLPINSSRCIARSTTSSADTMPSGNVGICSLLRGFGKDTNSESAVLSVAVHKAFPELEAVADVGTQVTVPPKLLDPVLNCTVPVGPAPLLVVFTVAVRVTLPPDATLVGLDNTAVVVVALVIVTDSGFDAEVLGP